MPEHVRIANYLLRNCNNKIVRYYFCSLAVKLMLNSMQPFQNIALFDGMNGDSSSYKRKCSLSPFMHLV